ncbi:MAG: hypothetical protein Q8K60_04510 [Parachlamydiaceae bacterium]|nr:hypothetical protein [Parachlamydiaceae bacterium]
MISSIQYNQSTTESIHSNNKSSNYFYFQNEKFESSQKFPEEFLNTVIDKIDGFSKKSFREIQENHHNERRPFYVCITEERGRNYFFDGYKFIENFKRCEETETILCYPNTKLPIQSFEIYQSTYDNPNLKPILNEADCKNPINSLQILYTNPVFSKKQRAQIEYLLSQSFFEKYQNENNDFESLEKAIIYAQKSSQKIHSAKYTLFECLKENHQLAKSFSYLIQFWKNHDDTFSHEGLLDIANQCEDAGYPHIALLFFEKGAYQGIPYSIAKTIEYYSMGIGSQLNLDKAEFWKNQLGTEWKNKSINAYLEYLGETQPNYDSENLITLNLPEEWLMKEQQIVLPNEKSISLMIGFCDFVKAQKSFIHFT